MCAAGETVARESKIYIWVSHWQMAPHSNSSPSEPEHLSHGHITSSHIGPTYCRFHSIPSRSTDGRRLPKDAPRIPAANASSKSKASRHSKTASRTESNSQKSPGRRLPLLPMTTTLRRYLRRRSRRLQAQTSSRGPI